MGNEVIDHLKGAGYVAAPLAIAAFGLGAFPGVRGWLHPFDIIGMSVCATSLVFGCVSAMISVIRWEFASGQTLLHLPEQLPTMP